MKDINWKTALVAVAIVLVIAYISKNKFLAGFKMGVTAADMADTENA